MADSRARLTDYGAALDSVLAHAAPLGTESCPLFELIGRVLATPVRAAHDMPFFDTSSVDGYAVTAGDIEEARANGTLRLELAGQIRAGADPTGIMLEPGSTLHILTGAPAPGGVAAMVMQEDVQISGTSVLLEGTLLAGQNVRYRGEEFRAGTEVVPAGVVVTPGVIAAIAASGQAQAVAYRRPRVGLLVTGDELVAPGSPLTPGRIYESNSFGVTASLQAMRFDPPVIRRVPDDPTQTRAALEELLRDCDVVLTSGGVSVGEFDTVKPALADIGVEMILWGVAIKPGKPFYFGRFPGGAHGPVVFGLPGNPVAVMVTFHTLVRPYLLKSTGLCGRPAMVRARLAAALTKEPGRLEFVPCRLSGGIADPVLKRGSHMLGTLTETNALALIPRDLASIEAGEEVDVMSLEGSVF